jgi:hypothetical protein
VKQGEARGGKARSSNGRTTYAGLECGVNDTLRCCWDCKLLQVYSKSL